MEIHERILKLLREKLPAELAYHNYEHTLDVAEAAERIAKGENASEEDIQLLKTAALLHDTGYIHSRENHELESCQIAKEILSDYGIAEDKIERVCELILATRMPHNPQDKLSQIICDADLDYLGRDDYFPISRKVYKEFKMFGIVSDEKEWKNVQVKFLESHKYFTRTANEMRREKKEEHLRMIRSS